MASDQVILNWRVFECDSFVRDILLINLELKKVPRADHSYKVHTHPSERMERIPVKSRTIASIGYALKERVLELEFRASGEVYQYFDVPAGEFTAFLASDSKGTYLQLPFKLQPYRYRRTQPGKE